MESSHQFEQREDLLKILSGIARNQPGATNYWTSQEMSAELGLDEPGNRGTTLAVMYLGLARESEDEEHPFELSKVGEQYLSSGGLVGADVLKFAASVFDDLNTRRAVLVAGARLFDDLSDAMALGQGQEVFASLLPPNSDVVVDGNLQARLLASLSAFLVRLEFSQPAGCLAEEVLAVNLIAEAEEVLDSWVGPEFTEESRDEAVAELEEIFTLFDDSDVTLLFVEQLDNAGNAVSPPRTYESLGIDEWFDVFYSTPVTGHVRARR